MSKKAARGLIVAIDGPAGAGKSTVAARIAARFGLVNLESGAMYRAFALKALERGTDLDDPEGLEQLARETRIRLAPAQQGGGVFLDGRDVTGRIRDADVTSAASRISVHPKIRQWLVELQRQLGRDGGVVMEGRDIGSVVFPDADVKVFLDASAEVRGQRRFEQHGARGSVPESVIEQMRERDRRDRTRAESPLAPTPGAIVLDSTDLTLEQVEDRIAALVADRLVKTETGAD